MKSGITNDQKIKERTGVPRVVLRAFIEDYKLQTAEDVQNALKDIFADTSKQYWK